MTTPAVPLPSQERLRQLLDYDPETGLLTWRYYPERSARWNAEYVGKPALTSDHGDGYLVGVIDGKMRRAHRVIFKWVHGTEPEEVDHDDRNRQNNRIDNLLPSTHLLNGRNQSRSVRNTSGTTGVCFRKAANMWVAKIRIGKKHIHLGLYATKEEAVAVRLAKQRELGFSEGHGG